VTDDGTPDQRGPSRQVEVYMQGMADITPNLPVAFEELEAHALEEMAEQAYGYVEGAAGAERTKRANDAAFEEYRLLPRMLGGVGERDRSVELFGETCDSPALLALGGADGVRKCARICSPT
jgi:isopentenyl-diphosphate delta-isomerase